MKSLSMFCLGLFVTMLFAAPVGAEVDAPRKRGGFATPTPAAKKSPARESTPRPKKKVAPANDDSAAEPKAKATPAPKKEAEEPPASTAEKATETPGDAAPAEKKERAPAATLAPEELAEFAAQPPRIQGLITAALELTRLNLTYTYGSDDPARGGMDCSGTMAHLLRGQGFKDVPRDSSSQYAWARKGGPFFAVVSKSAESFEFKDLQPGDLLFWTGTYETGREIPISHVMLYLGTEKKTKRRVMFGASDGRSYAGLQRWGVSVFDFKMPAATASSGERSKVDFVGYGRIPGLRDAAASPVAVQGPPSDPVPDEPAAVPAKARPSAKTGAASSSSRKKKRSE